MNSILRWLKRRTKTVCKREGQGRFCHSLSTHKATKKGLLQNLLPLRETVKEKAVI
jgi:hypothetical protein